jgi:hypothetical protein
VKGIGHTITHGREVYEGLRNALRHPYDTAVRIAATTYNSARACIGGDLNTCGHITFSIASAVVGAELAEVASGLLEAGALGEGVALGDAAATASAESAVEALPELEISASKYPDLAENISNAIDAGHPDVLTHGGDAVANRAVALKDVPNIRGLSRDEFPFASSMEGGGSSWIGHIPVAQQNAQGALITNFLRANEILPGAKYRVKIVP